MMSSALPEVSQRLRAQLPSESIERIGQLLVDSSPAVLGVRRLVWRRASGVRWNPADDFCLALELHVESSGRRELSGQLVEIEER